MLAPYRQVLSTPGALRFSVAGALARLPMSMVTISIVLLVQSVYGEYALAGRVAAVYVVAQAVFAPQLAKLVDAHGQARVMRPALAVAVSGLLGLSFAAAVQSHEAWLYVAAVVTGSTVGSMGALVRARWNRALDNPRRLHTAYSLESAIDELVFVVGPVLATTLATAIDPLAGLVIASVAACGGGFWFLAQRRTEPVASGRPEGADRTSVMRNGGMLVISAVFVAMGVIFGGTDVSTVAFAESRDAEAYAGVVLGVFAAGSLVSGLLYGARDFATALWKRFVLGIVALAIGTSLFVLVDSLVVLAAVMFVTGFTIAPTIIAGNALVQQLVPPRRLTEGLTWVSTSIGVGFAIGSSVAGAVIDAEGPHAGYYVVVGAAALATVVALGSARMLRTAVSRRVRVPIRPPAPDGPAPLG